MDLHIWIEWDYTVVVGLKTQSFVERAHPNVFVLSPLLLGHTLPREVFILFKSYSLIVLFFESSVHSHSAPWSSPYTPSLQLTLVLPNTCEEFLPFRYSVFPQIYSINIFFPKNWVFVSSYSLSWFSFPFSLYTFVNSNSDMVANRKAFQPCFT